ncbi:MAG: V-type ATPase 116kDa subunit family protein [Actinomadura sp.]
MPWREQLQPVRMTRVALVAPVESLRDVLVRTADAGVVELDSAAPEQAGVGAAEALLQRIRREPAAVVVCPAAPDLERLARKGRVDLLAGEAQLEARASEAVVRGNVAALVGWMPEKARTGLAARLAEMGGAIVPLRHPRGAEAPSLLPGRGVRRSAAALVETYGAVPYSDVDPTPFAWAAYVLMFGMMFGDAGHGLLLLAGAVALLAGRPRFLRRFRRAWPFVAGAGLASALFGFLYGEFFGPTGVVPVLWLSPVDDPVALMAAALGVGAVLLACSYAIGAVNRWREGGWPVVLYDPSGLAGASLFFGLGAVAAGLYLGHPWLVTSGVILAVAGLVLGFAGFLAAAGPIAPGIAVAAVELIDLVVRLGANVVSFVRLAAFGLAHGALASIVWTGTTILWQRGGAHILAALAVFGIGNAVAFAFEALVAGVQALRLEYYELFSRLFRTSGRPFRPWHIPVVTEPVSPRLTEGVDDPCPQN